MAPLCVLWIPLRDVFPHNLYTNVCHKCHSAKKGPASHRYDTVPNPGGYTQGPWSNDQKMPFRIIIFSALPATFTKNPKYCLLLNFYNNDLCF